MAEIRKASKSSASEPGFSMTFLAWSVVVIIFLTTSMVLTTQKQIHCSNSLYKHDQVDGTTFAGIFSVTRSLNSLNK